LNDNHSMADGGKGGLTANLSIMPKDPYHKQTMLNKLRAYA